MSTRTRFVWAGVAVALALGCRGAAQVGSGSAQDVREPAVAGQFYPADARTLNTALDLFLKDAVAPASESPIAIIAPHAGYVYSGQIAADAWRQAQGRPYDSVVILGTNHTTAGFDRIGVYPGSGLKTPLGTARIDEALSAALMKEDADCVADAAVHAREHSIEVQVPFAQRLFPGVSLVAAVVGTQDLGKIERFGRALAKVLAGRKALIVASSDLAHYPSSRDARETDRRTLEAFATLDPGHIQGVLSVQVGTRPNLETCACGEAPVLAAIAAAKLLGASRARVLSYANSGDLPLGDLDRAVGYGAVTITAGERGADTTVLVPPAPVAPDLPTPEADRRRLLELARETIRRYLDIRMVPLPRGLSPAADRTQGVFVTLRKHGDLRGCIGQMVPTGPLRRLVGRMALAAALEDPRFEQVRAAELKDITVEISVLTPFKPVSGPGAIVVGRDGVLLEKDRHAAVFLPQVATEEHWGRDEMLDNLCLKGGLSAGCWRLGAKLSTFQAEVFGEESR